MKQKTLFAGCLIVLVVALIEGFYAIQLKNIYYSHFAPFLDSVAYHNQMAILIETVRKKGFWAGLATNGSTVFLPFLEGAMLGLFMRPSRGIGIWLQVLWLAVLGISVFFYFYRFYIRKLTPALALTLPFIGIGVLWQFSGGLSDFRMDLHLYLLCSITFIWFLMTRYTTQLYPWLLTGLFAGLACLSRATAPVYLIVALAPILIVRLVQKGKERLRLLKRISLMTAIALLLAAWFYIVSFKYLYFYYVLWNSDANAKLPLQQSIQHFKYVIDSMGWFPAVLAAMLLPFTIFSLLKTKRLPQIIKALDWEALWLGIAPLAFLVLRGAGLNPFVSMPAVFGFVLFLLKPLRAESNLFRSLLLSSRGLLLVVVSLSLMVLSALGGIRNHLHPPFAEEGMMDAHHQVINIMLQDANARKDLEISFAMPYTGVLIPSSIWNVFVFDTPIRPKSVNGGILNRITNDNYFPIAAPADWNNMPGETDEQKIDNLVKQVQRRADYLIVPNEASLSFIEKNFAWILLNKYSRTIIHELLDQQWQPLGKPIRVTSFEEVQIYRKISPKKRELSP